MRYTVVSVASQPGGSSASLQLAAGVDIAIVSKRLGHSKIDLTSDTYGHLIGKAGKQAAEASAALVPRRRPA
jgi:integrase